MEAENNNSSDDSTSRASKRSKPNNDGEEKALDLDRISSLPNPILLHILSLLPATKYAARTSLLSKKWQSLWTFLPILDFSDSHICIHPSRFVPFVNHTLILHQPRKIQKFRVHMVYSKPYSSDVDVWLRFATRKDVEELDLEFHYVNSSQYSADEDGDGDEDEDENDDVSYVLPSNIFSNNSSLVTLKLVNIEIEHCDPIKLKSLKVLCLTNMALCNDFFPEFLSGCPSLELLELHSCYNYDFLDLKSESLKKLVIDDHQIGPAGVTALKISAPNLQSLDLSGLLNTYKISLINISSLVDAKLVFRLPSLSVGIDETRISKYPKILEELLENLRHIKDLTVGTWCLQVLSVLEEKPLPCLLSSLVCLTVDTELSKRELPAIARLLAVTPLLETLVLNVSSIKLNLMKEAEYLKFYDLGEENYWSSQKSSLELALLNLRAVKIVGFLATKSEVQLLFFLLKSASALEKMIIHARNTTYVSLKKSLEVAQRLFSFPRCSHDAVILFS